jgi:hypothetical protein
MIEDCRFLPTLFTVPSGTSGTGDSRLSSPCLREPQAPVTLDSQRIYLHLQRFSIGH